MEYKDQKFQEAYDLQYTLEATVMEYVNFNALDNLDALMAQTGLNFQQVKAPASGVVSYSIDGYEGMGLSEVSEASFDRSDYTKAITKAGKLIEQSAPVYKLVQSDNWSILFPLSEE